MKKDKIKYIFAFAILISLCILPALYAWINIYANKDPYANTGNIKIAVTSKDKGIDHEGKHINASKEVINNLKNNKNINFVVLKSPEKAEQGVESGKFYAAIIFEKKFTDNMYNIEKSINKNNTSITYITNIKKNSTAAKITDSATETLLEEINNKYIETAFNTIFKNTQDLSNDLKDKDAINPAIEKLTQLRNDLASYDETVKQFLRSNYYLKKGIKNTQNNFNSTIKNNNIESAKNNIDEAKTAVKTISDKINEIITSLKEDIDSLEKSINELKNTTDEQEKQKIKEEIENKADKILITLEKLVKIMPENSESGITQSVKNTINQMIKQTKNIKDTSQDIEKLENDVTVLKQLLETSLVSNLKNLITEFNNALELLKSIISNGTSMLNDINPILNASLKTTSSVDLSLVNLEKILNTSINKIDDTLNKLNNAKEEDKAKILTQFFKENPEEYSKFFSELVNDKTTKVYKAKNYGTAMTPFYSVLALWVGGVMLVSVLSLDTKKNKFKNKNEKYIFFKKFIPFFVLGQIQAAIIVAGDILLLNIVPVHPLLMFIAASIISLTFVMLIYSLAVSFGYFGKGVVVFIMILQIAGSSGSFPIEILPEIFSKIYRFFPFPYAINAMREALCGIYNYNFLIYLGQLLMFFVVGIIIGLVIKRPFTNMNNFVNEKLEKTEVL